MEKYLSFFKALLLFFSSKLSRKHHRQLQRKPSNNAHLLKPNPTPRPAADTTTDQQFESSSTLIFNVEDSLLRSTSLFPYFMLVAVEAGSPIRAIVLILLYPLIWLVGHERGLKVMVMICFFGIRKDGFMAGSSVLPKFFLEDVGLEGFEDVRKYCKRKVGVSDMPRVMVESFLRDYLEIEHILGRELKVFHGYFIGLMEDEKDNAVIDHLAKEISSVSEGKVQSNVIGFCASKTSLHHHRLISICKEIHLINKGDKTNWHALPKEMYPKPLIFHDGRLATKPTPEATLAILMWAPLGFILALLRGAIFLSFPSTMVGPFLAFMGIHLLTSKPSNSPSKWHHNSNKEGKGHLYVCNHRTLLDPLYLSETLGKPLTAVTYSLSRVSEILSPIKTIRLSRSRDQDAMMMKRSLIQGDLVVCPEGTTCREPYLLRFSPLFGEMSDHIVPVAMDCYVTMFHGTTAGGLKCLDPLFFLMNPRPSYTVQLLEKVRGSPMCRRNGGDPARFDVANLVQGEIGKALGFECTRLTRKDKYLILAGNEGISHH